MKRHYVLDPDGVIDVELTQTWKGQVRVTPRLIEYVQEYVDQDKTFQEALYEYISGDIDINTHVVWHGDTMEYPFTPCDSHVDLDPKDEYHLFDRTHAGRKLQIPGYEPYLGIDYVYLPVLSDDNTFVNTDTDTTDIALLKIKQSQSASYVVEVDANKNREEIDCYWDTVRNIERRGWQRAWEREQK